MGTLQDIQNIKYRSILDLIKNEESYDKKQKVISGLEAFYLCHKRYESLQNILLPLKQKLGKDIIITSANITNAMQDEMGIIIKYVKNSKLCMIAISIFDLEAFDIVLSDPEFDNEEFIEENRYIISEIIGNLLHYNYLDDPEIQLASCSKKLIINDNCNDYLIKSSEGKMFTIGTNHRLYDNTKNVYNHDMIVSENNRLTEELNNDEVINKIYSNLRIYEGEFPKGLIKKIT